MNTVYHIKLFGKRINDEQYNLADVNILFTEEENIHFYIKHIYDRTMFEKE